MAVTKWPSYLLRAIPADTRSRMTERAEADDISLADVVRQAICARFQMDCDQVSHGYQPDLDNGTDVLIIRLQPEVFRAMKKETSGAYGATRRLILESLDTYLEGPTQ